MLISFYHFPLCPRCSQARRHLKELLGEKFHDSVSSVNCLKHPLAAWQDNIRMVPALKTGAQTLSGITLSRDAIRQFLEQNKLLPSGTAK